MREIPYAILEKRYSMCVQSVYLLKNHTSKTFYLTWNMVDAFPDTGFNAKKLSGLKALICKMQNILRMSHSNQKLHRCHEQWISKETMLCWSAFFVLFTGPLPLHILFNAVNIFITLSTSWLSNESIHKTYFGGFWQVNGIKWLDSMFFSTIKPVRNNTCRCF